MTARAAAINPSDAAANGRSRGPRIVIASSGLGHVSRGIEAWAADLSAALARRGADVLLCKGGGQATAPNERVLSCWQRESLPAKRLMRVLPRSLAWRLGLGSGYGIEQTTFAWNLIRFLRSHQADLLHVQDPHLAILVQRARRLGLVSTRTILAHGTEEPASFLKKITYLQHLAPWHQQECEAAGAARPMWTTVPNFVDCQRFCPGSDIHERHDLRAELGIPDGALVVLTAAAIKRTHKRIDALLEEFARLRAADPELPVWLIIAGGNEADTDELVALGRRMLGDRVRFLVRFPRTRMADLYRAADVFVLTSLKEMMPIALLEATASGLPCVVNRYPVLEWIIGPGGAAIDMQASGALATALQNLLRDRAQREQLGQLARRHCVQHFGEQAVVDRILEYYQSVLAQTHGSFATSTEPASNYPTTSPVSITVANDRVSVVIPTFNAGPWIAQAVESVLSQSVRPAQIIVVNDGSTDDTPQRLAPYMDRICYVVQSNQGVAAARNHGIARASGNLIAFLDADDVWHPRKLELQLKALAENPDLGLLAAAVYDWPAPAIPSPDTAQSQTTRVPWRRLAVKNAFATSSVLVRREVLEKAGPFDTELRGPEDYDLWLRIAEVAPVAALNTPLVGYRTVSGSLGSRPTTMEPGLQRILRKLDERGAWQGRWLLRRKAHSFSSYSCAFLNLEAGDYQAALSRIISSFTMYPLPYRPSEVRVSLARVRLLSMILRRLRSSRALREIVEQP